MRAPGGIGHVESVPRTTLAALSTPILSPVSSNDLDAVAVWREVLGAYRAALEAHRSFLVASSMTLETSDEQDTDQVLFDIDLPDMFAAPAVLPPFPAELEPVAAALLAETEGLMRFAEHQVDVLRPVRVSRPAIYDVAQTGVSTMDRKL